MNTKMKKSLALLTLSSMMVAGTAYAEAPVTSAVPVIQPIAMPINAVPINAVPINAVPINAVPIPINAPSIPTTQLQPTSIKVNGEAIAETGFQPAGVPEAMIPLRAVTEKLGFTLTWNQETMSVDLAKGNLFTTVKTGEDRYVVNKMYITLGAAAQLVDNKLYVPASFVSRVLHGSAVTENGTLSISSTEAQKRVVATGVITEIRSSDKYQSIQIQGVGTNGMVLNVGLETGYQMLDGTPISFADLHVGLTVVAEHSLVSTMSLPPQTPTYKVTVLDAKTEAGMLGTAGTIEEVRTGDDGHISLLLKGSPLSTGSQSEVVLQVADTTAIVDRIGNAIEPSKLVKGANVIGYYNGKLTKSLPPIGTAWKLVVEEEAQ